MSEKLVRRTYERHRRYGYFAVDEFLDGRSTGTVSVRLTRKTVDELIDSINTAIDKFIIDNKLDQGGKI